MCRKICEILWITILLMGCSTGPTPMSPEQMQTAIALTVVPPSPTGIRLPDTWTPAPTVEHTATFTPIPTKEITTTQKAEIETVSATPKSIVSGTIFTFNGSGRRQSGLFFLTKGEVKIAWSAPGIPADQSMLNYLAANHENSLTLYKNLYQIDKNYYQNCIDEAAAQNDALTIVQCQRGLKQAEDTYNSRVQQENKNYKSEIAKYGPQISFVLKLERQSTGEIRTLVSTKGNKSGVVNYQSDGGMDYILSVDAIGNWSISISVP